MRVTRAISIVTLVLLVLAGAVWGCTPGHGPRLPGAVDAAVPTPAADAAIDPVKDAFEWMPDRRLTWADFQGPPDMMSDAAALTTYVLSYDTDCQGDRFTYQVVSRFLPRASWVKSIHLMDSRSDRTLQHEQTHFDLSEVHARRARQALAALVNPCARPEAEIDGLIKSFARDDGATQLQYDRETLHGTIARRQGEWDARVRTWLRDLPR